MPTLPKPADAANTLGGYCPSGRTGLHSAATVAAPDARLVEIARRARLALLPPQRLRLSEWIESNVVLPDDVSATPGRVRLWSFQREIADAISDPDIERVTLVKPVRVGFTTLLSGALASFVVNDPSPILSIQPTDGDCRDYIVSDVDPIFDASPALRGKMSGEVSKDVRSTMLARRFPGGFVKFLAAKSPRNLRRHNARILFLDEADAMEPSKEGCPIKLAERRTLSFDNRKIILGSTPTLEATSNVLRAYELSDKRVYEVPCPECGDYHEIQWPDIQWPEGKPGEAYYLCPNCGSIVGEIMKADMVAAGRWRATAPWVKGHAGFRLNALISPLKNASWAKLAAEFIAAKNNPANLQVFVNTILAQGWREAAEELDESELAARAEPFDLDDMPAAVLFLTLGVDVQKDRLELVFLGWGRDEIFVLHNRAIWGDPSQADAEVWRELDDVLTATYAHPLGGFLRIDACGIDASDGNVMGPVVAFARARLSRRVLAVKGASGFSRPIIEASAKKSTKLFILGVDSIKAQITARITRGRSVRFGRLESRFYEELTSERLVVRYVRGAPTRQWERIPGRRAECLDATVYAYAVRQMVQANPDRREEEVSNRGMDDAPAQTVVKSKWLSGG